MLTTAQLQQHLAPVFKDMGYTLVGSEHFNADNQPGTRLYIDKDGGVTCDDCAKASEQADAVLAVNDPQHGRYTLEVSSPGLDRPLFSLADYQQFIGRRANIQLRQAVGNQRRWQATIISVTPTERSNDGQIAVQAADDPTLLNIDFSNIEKARLVPELGESQNV